MKAIIVVIVNLIWRPDNSSEILGGLQLQIQFASVVWSSKSTIRINTAQNYNSIAWLQNKFQQ